MITEVVNKTTVVIGDVNFTHNLKGREITGAIRLVNLRDDSD